MSDDILTRIKNDIDRCKTVIASGDKTAARILSGELVNTYKGTVKHFNVGLTEYSYFEVANYIKDLLTLSRRLEAYAATLQISQIPEPKVAEEKPEQQQNADRDLETPDDKAASQLQQAMSLVTQTEELLNTLRSRFSGDNENNRAYLRKIEEIELIYRKQISRKAHWTELRSSIIWSAGLEPDIGCDFLKLIMYICSQEINIDQ